MPPSASSEPRYPYVHVDVAPEEVDETSALLFELGAEGVEERDDGTLAKAAASGKVTLVASFATRDDAEHAIAELDASRFLPRYEEIVGDAWRDAWKEHYRPFAIAPGLVVRPPWEAYEPKPGEQVLELEPGRAFGTGLHETTRLVAQALQRYARELAGATVLDVGCGSGILALAALVLGAQRAVALDVDQEAIDVTNENAQRNGLSSRIDASTRDLAVLDLATPVTGAFGAVGRPAAGPQVVVANIEAKVLIPLAAVLERHVAKGGLLLLSGILVTQKDDVRNAYPDLELLEAPAMGEWVLLALRKR